MNEEVLFHHHFGNDLVCVYVCARSTSLWLYLFPSLVCSYTLECSDLRTHTYTYAQALSYRENNGDLISINGVQILLGTRYQL